MRRVLLTIAFIIMLPYLARANATVQGWCEAGNTPVVTAGLTSTTLAQGSVPSCTVTVFTHGAGLASIFSDNSGTVLANPFTAQTNGRWIFYVANGRYDVQLTNVSPVLSVTYSDLIAFDPLVFSSITSGSVNPALTGFIRMANGDHVSWRNSVNAGDMWLQPSGVASGNAPADTLQVVNFSGLNPSFVMPSNSPSTAAVAGQVRLDSAGTINWRNAGNTADVNLAKDANDNISINGPVGLSFSGNAPNPSGSGAIVYNQAAVGPTVSGLNVSLRAGATPAEGLRVAGTLVTVLQPLQFLTTNFAGLGAVPGAGIAKYCTDCTTAATCAGSGSGHLAVSNGTNWTCQ